ncbi:MAG: sel1 repeat family protein [Acidobacteria bacterium]|nr:sel1 repeat family protein [Acidobacteriota bacterium]
MRTVLCLAFVLGQFAAGAADFNAGIAAYEKGDFVKARAEWEPLAEAGDPPAQFNLALLFYDGRGAPQDYEAAFHWFSRAANQGYVKAERNLGAMYAEGRGAVRDYIKAYKWFALCSAAGNDACTAQRDLAAKRLNSGKLSEARRLAREFKPTMEKKDQESQP